MTPGARVAAAIDILTGIDAGGRPADDIAADYFRRRRYIGAKDRAQISGYVYTVLRHRAVIDWWIERVSRGEVRLNPRSRMIAVLLLAPAFPSPSPTLPRMRGREQDATLLRVQAREGWGSNASGSPAGWSAEDVASAFDGDRFRPEKLSAAELRLARGLAGRSLTHPEMPRAVACDIPDWLEPYLARLYGRRLEDEMAALNAPAPLDLRVNALKADREAARRALAAERIAAEPTPWSPLGLRIKYRAPLAGTAAFKEGLVEVQDEGSQIAALLADARPGMRVVDFCAGAGGKTLALAAQMQNRGKLVACDTAAWRLERAGQRLRRAGVSNVERRTLSSERDPWVKRHARSFDRVFVDAPCLGIGSWRRNPDGKWRCRPEDVAELVERQRDILASAARLVKPGGRLVYVTCSLLCEENEAQAEAFLGAHPEFTLYPAGRAWGETIGGNCPADGDHLRLTPARHGTDGFFAAIFERQAPHPDPHPPAGDGMELAAPEGAAPPLAQQGRAGAEPAQDPDPEP